eukprot:jgi/Phyca11/511499/fgenesh2_kg.PHYCAscaffold_87_\
MAGPNFRFVSVLLLLVAVACSCSFESTSAEAPVAADARLLREQVEESTSHSSSFSGSSSGSGFNASTINTEESATESTESKHEGPTLMSFVGPAIAGVLAIVLIGAVVTFKNRMG